MNWSVFENPNPNTMHVRVSGTYDFDSILNLVAECRTRLNRAEDNIGRILINLLDMEGEVSTVDRFRIGEHLADTLREAKLGVLYRMGPRADDRFLQHVVNNRGGSLELFSNIDDALAWLQQTK